MSRILLGIEKLMAEPPRWLREKRSGLLANQASVDSHLNSTPHLLTQAYPDGIKALFGPQHGFRGEKQDNMVESEHLLHPRFNLPVFSLYGPTLTPTRDMLDLIDILIVDIQDIGTRVYTFITTLAYCMKAAGEAGKKVVVLDRPNPIGGDRVEGNLLKDELCSFVGPYPLPMRHGLTIGEVARLFNGHYRIGCDLEVISMDGWRRTMLFNATGYHWIPPSPNMPSPTTALVYPGQVVLEGTNLSEGRGTTRPFELCGAPFIDPYQLKANLDRQRLPGIYLREATFQPTFNKWSGEVCGGLQIHITDPAAYKPYLTTLAIIREIRALYPRHFSWSSPPYEYEAERLPIDLLTGDSRIREAIDEGMDLRELEGSWQTELDEYGDLARHFLLYQ